MAASMLRRLRNGTFVAQVRTLTLSGRSLQFVSSRAIATSNSPQLQSRHYSAAGAQTWKGRTTLVTATATPVDCRWNLEPEMWMEIEHRENTLICQAVEPDLEPRDCDLWIEQFIRYHWLINSRGDVIYIDCDGLLCSASSIPPIQPPYMGLYAFKAVTILRVLEGLAVCVYIGSGHILAIRRSQQHETLKLADQDIKVTTIPLIDPGARTPQVNREDTWFFRDTRGGPSEGPFCLVPYTERQRNVYVCASNNFNAPLMVEEVEDPVPNLLLQWYFRLDGL